MLWINKLDFKSEINQKILNLIGKIDLYKGKWNALENKKIFTSKNLEKL